MLELHGAIVSIDALAVGDQLQISGHGAALFGYFGIFCEE
jgi:hypothetical protein